MWKFGLNPLKTIRLVDLAFPSSSKTTVSSQQPAATNTAQATSQPASQNSDQNQFSATPQSSSAASQVAARLQAKGDGNNRAGFGDSGGSGSRVQTSGYQQSEQDSGKVKQVAYQYPELGTPDRRPRG